MKRADEIGQSIPGFNTPLVEPDTAPAGYDPGSLFGDVALIQPLSVVCVGGPGSSSLGINPPEWGPRLGLPTVPLPRQPRSPLALVGEAGAMTSGQA